MASPPQPPSHTGKPVAAASDPLLTGAAATSGPHHVAASDPLPTGAAASSGLLPVPASDPLPTGAAATSGLLPDPLSEGSGHQPASGHGSNQGPLSGEGSNERQLSDQGSQVAHVEDQGSNEEVAAEEVIDDQQEVQPAVPPSPLEQEFLPTMAELHTLLRDVASKAYNIPENLHVEDAPERAVQYYLSLYQEAARAKGLFAGPWVPPADGAGPSGEVKVKDEEDAPPPVDGGKAGPSAKPKEDDDGPASKKPKRD